MGALVDAVRTARRKSTYARLRRAQVGSARGSVVAALLTWGIPAVAPMLALLAVAVGRADGLFEVGLALGVTALQAHLLGKPRLQAFDLLHQPARRGIALGHLLYRAPWLLWAGATSGAAWIVLMPWVQQQVGGGLMLGAVVLAPAAVAASSGATRLAGRAGRDETAGVLPFLLPLLGWEAARIWLDEGPWPWVLPIVGGAAGVLIAAGTGTLVATLRRACVLVVVTLLVASPSAPRGPVFTDDSAQWLVAGAVAALCCVAAIALSLRTQLVCADLAEVVETRADAAGRAPGATASRAAAPLRRECAGTGLWRARLRMAEDAWLPEDDESRSGARTVSAWAGSSLILLLTVLRGPVLAAVAVALSGETRTPVWLAVLAGCLADRVASVDRIELQPRLWLLGVDYREQVLHGLRSLLVFAAVPTLVVALFALAIAGPQEPGRQAAVMVIAAAILLRAGLPGLWPLQETHRMRLVLVWTGVMALAVVYGTWWPALQATYAAGAAACLGSLLLLARLVRLREPHVADCVRRSEEP